MADMADKAVRRGWPAGEKRLLNSSADRKQRRYWARWSKRRTVKSPWVATGRKPRHQSREISNPSLKQRERACSMLSYSINVAPIGDQDCVEIVGKNVDAALIISLLQCGTM